MPYRVELETRAGREFRSFPKAQIEGIASVLDDLARDPRPPGARKLTGVDGYRVRRGSYRVLFTIDDKSRRVRVYRIGHRRDVYRK